MSSQIELSLLVQSSGADGALVINENGELLDAVDVSHDGNIAAMTHVVFKMLGELTEDLGHGEVSQITCKSEGGFYVIHKFDKDNIVCIHSSDIAKVGYLMMALKAVKL